MWILLRRTGTEYEYTAQRVQFKAELLTVFLLETICQ